MRVIDYWDSHESFIDTFIDGLLWVSSNGIATIAQYEYEVLECH